MIWTLVLAALSAVYWILAALCDGHAATTYRLSAIYCLAMIAAAPRIGDKLDQIIDRWESRP